jgi:hypothetical protein
MSARNSNYPSGGQSDQIGSRAYVRTPWPGREEEGGSADRNSRAAPAFCVWKLDLLRIR